MADKKSKREAIIYSALKIFERDGFHKAKVEEIAKEANVGKGTIYEYFKSKKDLFCQMVKHMMDLYIDMIKEIVEENIDPITKLQHLLNLQLELAKKHGALGHMIQIETIKSGIGKDIKPYFLEFRKKTIGLIEKIIEEGIEKKLFKKIDTYVAALFFIGSSNQFAFEINFVRNCKDEYDHEGKLDVEEFMNAFLKGLIK
ncbi:TetR/AcrR family transcriptional regulator [Paramaledivibacter caminithermalis]|uniref:Transcriptional regulator, TetR family n=1 Tax=Paramaledivibacter caminithermalis (strain DSM 15212 / CIP 107654 / DViRD3) TaxID=1121301 RepID=A0A1M6RQB7_PARC5|nr:TetR/AcrR family transcriptional regulator [Paramaledivibacter caminithermalis]SHK34635.1 transcriptional regulator, TetR family [Paramaledivibacter caminithermalis DSM 15212]